MKNNQTLNKQLISINEKLKESGEAKSNFLWNIKKELNSPLSSIMGLAAQVQKMDDSQPKEMKQIASIVQEEILNLSFLLNNIFLASEIELDELDISYGAVDINKLIDKVIHKLRFEANKKFVTIKKYVDPRLLTNEFVTSADYLHDILINLLSNAIKFSNPDREIFISAKLDNDGKLIVRITDRGEGMDKKMLEQIYDKHYHHNNLNTNTQEGTGLGMAVVKALLEVMDGSLTIESERNKGTRMTIALSEAK